MASCYSIVCLATLCRFPSEWCGVMLYRDAVLRRVRDARRRGTPGGLGGGGGGGLGGGCPAAASPSRGGGREGVVYNRWSYSVPSKSRAQNRTTF